MSMQLYPTGGVRFWDQKEIEFRDLLIQEIPKSIISYLQEMNMAWRSLRCEGPILTPSQFVHESYDYDDVFSLVQMLGKDAVRLRPETTASSYEYARHILQSTKHKLPLCVWQAGKSFRVESSDGARAANLRFNEFWQMEFQCIYSKTTMADYRAKIEEYLPGLLEWITGNRESRVIDSDRLPHYSVKTRDVELLFKDDFKEVCSISTRTDYSEDALVLEIAIGLDRLVEIWNERRIYEF